MKKANKANVHRRKVREESSTRDSVKFDLVTDSKGNQRTINRTIVKDDNIELRNALHLGKLLRETCKHFVN